MKTTKLLISLFLLLLLSSNLQGQIGSIGLKGIYCISSQSYSGTSSRTTFTGGGFIDYNLGKYFRLSLDAANVNKGITVQAYTSNNSTENVETNLNYISLALPVKFGKRIVIHINKEENEVSYFYPYMFVGPRIDISTNQDENGLNGLYEFQKKINIGSSLGLGFMFYKKDGLLAGGEVRFSPDFYTYPVKGYTYKNKTLVFSDNTTFRNQPFELSAFFGFAF